jgi:adhesin/invasin
MIRVINLLLLTAFLILYACGGGGGGGGLPDSGGGSNGGGGSSSNPPASITLAANPTSITVLGTSSISAIVLDSDGINVADGTVVTFTLSSSTFGTINAQATTSSGTATATFTASTTPGTVIVTGTAGSVDDTVNITISAPDAGSIEFDSATPSVIGIRGSGQTETSLVKFLVKDINGNAVVDGTQVDFVMSGPGGGRLPASGGEYIGSRDASPTTATSSTVNGEASVYLNSGTVAGPVIIVATVNGTSMSSSSTPISIGGGVPNDAHLTLASDIYNLEGLGWVNIQANISVYMADRFGNYNVLEGTAMSFYAESGAIDRNAVTDANGSASVVFRTQNPVPADVAPEAWENTLCTRLETDYGINISTAGVCIAGHPRDGWATIMVTTRGEEAFIDKNGNGSYNAGETFTDTPQEAFLDANDNDAYDDGSADPEELYIDDNGGGTCNDAVNGSWDSNKTISKDIKLLITGIPAYIETNPNTFAIANGGSQAFTLLVSDINLNPLIGGTTVDISTDVGTLAGTTSYTFPDTFIQGPVELSFILKDADNADTNPLAEVALITITVSYKGTDYPITVTGTID